MFVQVQALGYSEMVHEAIKCLAAVFLALSLGAVNHAAARDIRRDDNVCTLSGIDSSAKCMLTTRNFAANQSATPVSATRIDSEMDATSRQLRTENGRHRRGYSRVQRRRSDRRRRRGAQVLHELFVSRNGRGGRSRFGAPGEGARRLR